MELDKASMTRRQFVATSFWGIVAVLFATLPTKHVTYVRDTYGESAYGGSRRV